MLFINFVQFMANLLLAGFLIRLFEAKFPDTTAAKALATVY